MKRLIGLIFFCSSLVSYAGDDTPWPLAMEQEIKVEYLSGIWESMNFTDPHLVYDIRMELTYFEHCPYVLTVAEIADETGYILSHGTKLICGNKKTDRLILILYDGVGRAKKRLKMVGLLKDTENSPLSFQYLGLTLMNFKDDHRISEDIFHKRAE